MKIQNSLKLSTRTTIISKMRNKTKLSFCPSIQVLFLLITTFIPSLTIAITKATATHPNTSDQSNTEQLQIFERNQIPFLLSAKDAAISMNSIHFLKELVKMKDTVNEKYYYNDKKNEKQNHHVDKDADACANATVTNHDDIISVVEYTGRLWFLKTKQNSKNTNGIEFQESVRIHNLSECGQYSTIECLTKYKRKDKWIDCSRIICSFESNHDHEDDEGGGGSGNGNDNGARGLVVKMRSEILMRIPLFGINGAVKKHILKSFHKATDSYFRQLGNVPRL